MFACASQAFHHSVLLSKSQFVLGAANLKQIGWNPP